MSRDRQADDDIREGAYTRFFDDAAFLASLAADPTPVSRDREEARDARRLASEADDYVQIGYSFYRWSDLPSADEL